ncbi:MAG: NADAR family protein [Candidatus Rhabdochlamydia sp.]
MNIPKASLSKTLLVYSSKDYQNLFTPEVGFLTCLDKSKTWKIEKKTPENLVEYYSDVINCLIKTKAYQEIPNLTAFVKCLNTRLTSVLMKDPFDPACKHNTIFFNSKNQNFQFLSNFYSTLILFKDHDHPEKTRLYPTCENAYQAHKIKNIIQSQKEKPEISGYEIYSGFDFKDLEQLATISPPESKKLANELISLQNTDEIAIMKYNLMNEIVKKKFQDNPTIDQWLKETASSCLVEDTNDKFWGSKQAHVSLLSKNHQLPISAKSRNVLGRILMDIRTSK